MVNKRYIGITEEEISLDKFLKWSAVLESGGQAKTLIQQGSVKVNGSVETRRSRRLKVGDVVEIDDLELQVKKEG